MSRTKRSRAHQKLLDAARLQSGDTGEGGLALLDETGALVHLAPASITSGVRYMLARLQTQEKGDVPETMAVTSALEGEGVTFVSRSLGVVMANDLSRRVCIVELNWWSPSAMPGNAPRPGMAQVISGEVPLESALVTTANRRLSLLPAGAALISQRPVLARSAALGDTLDELRTRFDHLVLDVPPVLSTGDALTLAAHSDGVAVVVRQGYTDEHHVKAALEELRPLHTLGVILNRTSSRVPARLLRIISPT